MNLNKQLIQELIKGHKVDSPSSLNSFIGELTKEVIEGLLDGELNEHLGYDKHIVSDKATSNSRNGRSNKKVITQSGKLDITVPRDRNSEFDPIIVPKGSKDMTLFSEKVISLYARGLTQRDIADFVKEQYNYQISAQSISNIIDTVTDRIKEWQSRPLDKIYPIVYMDALVYKVKQDGTYKDLAINTMIGINIKGHKQCLGFWTVENESATFWLSVLNEIRSRGVEDILILCSDGLKGLGKSIKASFPDTRHQKCVIHQIRNSLKHLSYKTRKEVANDLKPIYKAINKEVGYEELVKFDQKWSTIYPYIAKSWYNNWEGLSVFFNYSEPIRKIIYTTNAIESFNQSLRKVTKHRGAFTSEEALMKLLFLQTERIEEKWNKPVRGWDLMLGQFSIIFDDRLEKYLKE